MKSEAKPKCLVIRTIAGPCSRCGSYVLANGHFERVGKEYSTEMHCEGCCPETPLGQVRRRQRESGDYIRSFHRHPEWLGDVEGAKRGAEDNLMEEALILREGL